MNQQRQKKVDERIEEIQDRISAYSKRIQQLQFEISSYQDLISDLNSDIQMIAAQKGGFSGNKKEKDEKKD